MKAHQKLKNWRENDMGMSTHDLANLLEEKMKPDFPNGFKRGEKIFQSDIVLAEKGDSRKRFEKVSEAIYKYLDIQDGFFGKFVAVHPDDVFSVADMRTEEYRKQSMELQTRLLDAHEAINQLNLEKIELLKRNFELQTEVMELKRKVEDMGRGK